MKRLRRALLLLCVPALAWLATTAGESDDGPYAIAGPAGNAVLRFRVQDPTGALLASRLTFLGAGDGDALFPAPEAAPGTWAVRGNVVYTLAGEGALELPAGRYEVLASRGLEWSVDRASLELAPGAEARWDATLVHEVDTTGWVSGDYHLHTLTYSGHGDANVAERVVSLIGEGVEFAVATDHNHNTDYAPTLAKLDATERLAAVTGNEVSVPVGHFNAFPLDPERAPPASDFTDANELFRVLRAEENRYGVPTVIQLNHPRWEGIDYFTQADLDPATGTSSSPRWSADFDSIEVLNENASWGWFDPETDGVDTRANLHRTVRDWFHLLNRGHRSVAVGNSDSHRVRGNFAGYPRNFTASPTDRIAEITPGSVAAALRAGTLMTTTGPFVELWVQGERSGALVGATPSEAGPPTVTVRVRVQAASWIDCDRVRLVWNGDVVRELSVPRARLPLRLDEELVLPTPTDGWLALLVDGDEPLAPLVESGSRPVLPLAIVNPVRVDADGDGVWRSPLETALAASGDAAGGWDALAPHARAARLWTATGAATATLAARGLADADRTVRLAAARTAERSAAEELLPALRSRLSRPDLDAYEALALVRAALAAGADDDLVAAWITRFGAGKARRYVRELEPLLGGDWVTEFLVLGPFPAPEQGTLALVDLGPERAFDPAATYAGVGGEPVGWRPLGAEPSTGYLDLREVHADPSHVENAFVYAQTFLRVDTAREVLCTWGTDDGSRVHVNGELVYDEPARRGANPLEHLGAVPLRAGWNRVLFEVENGTGGFGLYFRVLSGDVEVSADRGTD